MRPSAGPRPRALKHVHTARSSLGRMSVCGGAEHRVPEQVREEGQKSLGKLLFFEETDLCPSHRKKGL